MLAFSFAYRCYKNSGIGDVCRPCQINVSGLMLANEGPSSKEEDLVGVFFRRLAKNVSLSKRYRMIDPFILIWYW